jgi:SpoU rRNA methylase family enzyme
MSFHIGTQNAGVVNNVGRDQHIIGAQQGTLVVTPEVREALDALRSAVASADLDGRQGREATRQLDEIEVVVGSATPEPERVAGPLEKLTRLLVAAGPIAAAVGPLQTLAGWLGQLGAGVLRLLPGLG